MSDILKLIIASVICLPRKNKIHGNHYIEIIRNQIQEEMIHEYNKGDRPKMV